MEILKRRDYFRKTALPLFAFLFLHIYAMPYLRCGTGAIAGDDVKAAASASVKETQADVSGWNSFGSHYFTVHYSSDVSLKKIDRQLRKRAFFFSHSSGDSVEEKIASRLDQLCERAKQILDMRPNLPKITIRIFSGRDEVVREYNKLFHIKQDMKSFYVNKYSTIYTSEDDISDSVIVHEIGHAIIDNYFAAVPPPKVAEILASFVDVHLDDE